MRKTVLWVALGHVITSCAAPTVHDGCSVASCALCSHARRCELFSTDDVFTQCVRVSTDACCAKVGACGSELQSEAAIDHCVDALKVEPCDMWEPLLRGEPDEAELPSQCRGVVRVRNW